MKRKVLLLNMAIFFCLTSIAQGDIDVKVFELNGQFFSSIQLEEKYGDRMGEAIAKFGFRELSKKEFGEIMVRNLSREKFIEAYNQLSKDVLNNGMRSFARIKNDSLQFYNEWILPEKNNVFIELSKAVPHTIMIPLLETQDYRNLLVEGDFEVIEFITIFYFPDSTDKTIRQVAQWDDFRRLHVPFTEKEFSGVLE